MLFFLIILGSLALALYTTLNARLVREGAVGVEGGTGWSSTFVLGGSKAISGLYIAVPWAVLLILGYVKFPTSKVFWLAFLVTLVLNVTFEILRFRAYALTNVGLIAPFGAISPMLTILFSWLLLAETPSLLGAVGIIIIATSIYLLYLKDGLHWNTISGPFRAIWRDRGVRYGFLSALPPALAIVYDKKAIVAADPITFSMLSVTFVGLSAWMIDYALQGRHKFIAQFGNGNIKRFFQIAVLYVIANLSFNLTFYFAIVPYVSALRRIVIVFEVLLAYYMLKERADLRKRVLAAVGVVMGAILIGLAR